MWYLKLRGSFCKTTTADLVWPVWLVLTRDKGRSKPSKTNRTAGATPVERAAVGERRAATHSRRRRRARQTFSISSIRAPNSTRTTWKRGSGACELTDGLKDDERHGGEGDRVGGAPAGGDAPVLKLLLRCTSGRRCGWRRTRVRLL
jgi:hypothetical protein